MSTQLKKNRDGYGEYHYIRHEKRDGASCVHLISEDDMVTLYTDLLATLGNNHIEILKRELAKDKEREEAYDNSTR